ncbi:MAG: FecR domain-containing protein [Verrucomicrobiae bacterium]|nr:FecR domain-containing protein [Verrucomicrobiae bacterium]
MNENATRLIQRYIDGSISAADLAQLNARLSADTGLRREFADLLNLDSALAAAAAGRPRRPAARPRVLAFPIAVRWLAAACVALLASGCWWWQAQRVFATVVKDAGVEELPIGAALRGETRALKAGSVELLTTRGARVVIEAPAEFRFESAQRLRMVRGRLSAEVPPAAKGFTVITPSGDAVDLGTRFGVDVPAAGAAEIHVFEGEVIAKATGERTGQSLRGGDAVAMNRGASSTRGFRSAAFIQTDELPELSAALAAGQRARSDAALAALTQDPALIALLDFESDAPEPGTFRRVQGRWPGSRAPEFVNVGDHLKLDAGGDRVWPQLTLAAWVRLDRLGAPFQSLLHTDGWNTSNPGQVHWMVTHDATMRLALFDNTLAPGSNEFSGFPNSRTPVLPEQGRWVHLATVYDSAQRSTRFYLNGRPDSESRHMTAHPARLGPAQIGNWDSQDRKLSGRIDELLILGRAMSDAEVMALFSAGNPYQ